MAGGGSRNSLLRSGPVFIWDGACCYRRSLSHGQWNAASWTLPWYGALWTFRVHRVVGHGLPCLRERPGLFRGPWRMAMARRLRCLCGCSCSGGAHRLVPSLLSVFRSLVSFLEGCSHSSFTFRMPWMGVAKLWLHKHPPQRVVWLVGNIGARPVFLEEQACPRSFRALSCSG